MGTHGVGEGQWRPMETHGDPWRPMETHVWNQDTFGESGGSGWSSFRLCLVVAIFRSEAMRCQEGLRAERARAQYGSPLGNPLS